MKIRMMRFEPRRCGRAVALAVALVMTVANFSVGGQIVDRVVTNVNGHVILQSDWEEGIAFEAFSNGRDPDSATAEERIAGLNRLIDQELLREQVRPSQPVPTEQIAVRVTEIRKLHPECTTAEAWHAKLARYGLSESAIEKYVGEQLQIMRLVEDRLRPSIQIDQQAVEAYYKDQLLPQMEKAGSHPTPLPQVFTQIKDLLAEKKMNELLSGWLATLRTGSRIVFPDTSAGEQSR